MRNVLRQQSLANRTSFRTPPPEGSGGSGAVRWMARRKAYPLHTSQTTDQGASDPRLDQEEAPALLLARFRRTFSFLSEVFLSEVSLSGPGLVSSPSRTCAAPGSETRTAHRARATPRLGTRRPATEPTHHDHFSPIDRRRGNRRLVVFGLVVFGLVAFGPVVFGWIVSEVDRTESSAAHPSFDARRGHFAAKRAQAARSNVKS